MEPELSPEAVAYLGDLRRMSIEEIGERRVREDQVRRSENARRISRRTKEQVDGTHR